MILEVKFAPWTAIKPFQVDVEDLFPQDAADRIATEVHGYLANIYGSVVGHIGRVMVFLPATPEALWSMAAVMALPGRKHGFLADHEAKFTIREAKS